MVLKVHEYPAKQRETMLLNKSDEGKQAEKRYRAFMEFMPYPVVVFDLDSKVAYLNPAFENVFGWTFKELEGSHIPFVPGFLKNETRRGTERMFREKITTGFETKRLTRDGRILDIVLDGAIFYENDGEPAGQVITLRDVTRERRTAQSSQALFRIAQALPLFRRLDHLLEFIIREVKLLLEAGGASIILLDEEKQEFYFREATFEHRGADRKIKEIRFPVDKGVAGYVYRTGKSLIVSDTSESPYFFKGVDDKTGYRTLNMVDVPMRTRDKMIGVLCAVNKKEGVFDQEDADLLSTIATTVALPIENARINEALKRSYDEVQSLNRAKDRVIHHLSHELKTPVSVLSGSLGLLEKKLSGHEDMDSKRILERAQRNLNRILDMQYEIDDILQDRSYRTFHMLSKLLDVSLDQLEVLVSEEKNGEDAVESIRRRVEEIFGPRDSSPEEIRPGKFTEEHMQNDGPVFAHRKCRIFTNLEPDPCALIPREVLAKIIKGLLRNAIENTPDEGRIDITVRDRGEGVRIEIADRGVGITEENQRLIFESYFTSHTILQYASRKPYDFYAGGKGFDLLRMKIFSERYHFEIQLSSTRCGFIPRDEDLCPGNIEDCTFCSTLQDCVNSGGTSVIVRFAPVEKAAEEDFGDRTDTKKEDAADSAFPQGG